MNTSNAPYKLEPNAVWLITGCSSGIGLALATLLATKTSHRLVVTARNVSSLASITDTPDVLKLSLDVTSRDSINAAIAQTVAKFGRLDVLVNNAGYAVMGDTEAATEEQAHKLINTDFWGTVWTSLSALRVMRDENPKTGTQGGLIMNVTSMGGFIGFPGSGFYHAAKFAVEGFTESVSKEMRPEWNIHFTIIEPGGVETNFATASLVKTPPHPAYTAPDTPSRVLEAYMSVADNRKTWAKPVDIAAGIYEVAGRGKIPVRAPLGPDAWGMMKQEIAFIDKELDDIKDLSQRVGHKDQMASLDFMKS